MLTVSVGNGSVTQTERDVVSACGCELKGKFQRESKEIAAIKRRDIHDLRAFQK